MKVLIDTNVVLDVLLEREPWVSDSRSIWDANHHQQIQGYVVATTVTNLFYIARRLVGHSSAIQGVSACLKSFLVLPVDGNTLNEAVNLSGNDFEDNVSIRCAVNFQMDAIVTRNPSDFLQSPVSAISPATLLASLKSSST